MCNVTLINSRIVKMDNLIKNNYYAEHSKTNFYTPQNFFKDAWNVFDFITVIGSIIDALVLELGVSSHNCAQTKEKTETLLLCCRKTRSMLDF